MSGLTQITVRMMQRPELAYSWHVVADLTMPDGRVVHWPKSDLGAGILVDELNREEGLKLFVADLTEMLKLMPG